MGLWLCFCFAMVLFFSNRTIIQASEKKDTAKTYYAHLQELEKKEKKLEKKAKTTWDMNQTSNEIYKMWDDELNTVYKRLKLKLSKKKFKKIQMEQKEWITYKEKEVEKVRQEWRGGTGETWNVLGTHADITKKRVYELAELLYGKNPNQKSKINYKGDYKLVKNVYPDGETLTGDDLKGAEISMSLRVENVTEKSITVVYNYEKGEDNSFTFVFKKNGDIYQNHQDGLTANIRLESDGILVLFDEFYGDSYYQKK